MPVGDKNGGFINTCMTEICQCHLDEVITNQNNLQLVILKFLQMLNIFFFKREIKNSCIVIDNDILLKHEVSKSGVAESKFQKIAES